MKLDDKILAILLKYTGQEWYSAAEAIADIKALFDYDDSKTLIERKREFKASLVPYIEKYGEQMIVKFFDYWTEHGEKARKFRMEKQKSWNLPLRLRTWEANQKKFSIAGLIANRK